MIVYRCACYLMISVPVNGGYTQWTSWGACPVTCGGSTHQRTRSCTQPIPLHGGLTCIQQNLGPATESEACGNALCPSK